MIDGMEAKQQTFTASLHYASITPQLIRKIAISIQEEEKIGHGAIGENALKNWFHPEKNFPYTFLLFQKFGTQTDQHHGCNLRTPAWHYAAASNKSQ